jgi:hypothetical protein
MFEVEGSDVEPPPIAASEAKTRMCP